MEAGRATPPQPCQPHACTPTHAPHTTCSSLHPAPPIAVNEGNCSTLANLEDVDGFLVGGASLKGGAFIQICNAENKHS